jgi:hypothetical protein
MSSQPSPESCVNEDPASEGTPGRVAPPSANTGHMTFTPEPWFCPTCLEPDVSVGLNVDASSSNVRQPRSPTSHLSGSTQRGGWHAWT